ncbi:hypothetical protein [Engelhardtia mirabilis]|uniref:Uncharacterized protein n=1 Tax=Engelhardtia mirabilis TaxID=2528011 RepID=A0A518BEA7_9BACT|nr:hypothetical protein Pla133_03830 [Planctomycetes bacterium Pla133]QDU99644.1 hypothetical protein Pla86_03830 [Planctomycetes bacterium Pla86]
MKQPTIDQAIAELLESRESFSSSDLARRLGITRQAVHPQLRRRVAEGQLSVEGRSRATRYVAGAAEPLAPSPALPQPPEGRVARHPLEGLDEHSVWEQLEGATTDLHAAGAERCRKILA